MMSYSIFLAPSARKELQTLPLNIAERILQKIEQLIENPRPAGVKKIKGSASLFRLRVGEYRVVYEIDDRDHIVDISVIRHRSEAYR
jgi:mRNA interferase RelE/StbE